MHKAVAFVLLLLLLIPLTECTPPKLTTENMMKVHQGMNSNEILEMFGTPKNVSQSVCGSAVGKPWNCTTWEYADYPYDRASFRFAGNSGSLILNDFDFHKKY
jgi:hypothetical protein